MAKQAATKTEAKKKKEEDVAAAATANAEAKPNGKCKGAGGPVGKLGHTDEKKCQAEDGSWLPKIPDEESKRIRAACSYHNKDAVQGRQRNA